MKCTQIAAGKATGEWKNKLINTKHSSRSKEQANHFVVSFHARKHRQPASRAQAGHNRDAREIKPHASKWVQEQGKVTLGIKGQSLQAEDKQQNKKRKSTGGLSPHNYKAKPARSSLSGTLQLPGTTILLLAHPGLDPEGAVEHLHVEDAPVTPKTEAEDEPASSS